MSDAPPPVPPPALAVPTASLKAGRSGLGWFWLLPALTLAIVAGVVWLAQAQRGPRIVVQFKDGNGLKAGDPVRHRGVTVGEVRSVELSPDLQGVTVVIDLRPTAAGLARENSRFWVVRPQADLTGVSGLDTVVGAKYVAVSPGGDGPRFAFVGDEAPVLEEVPGGLRVVVQDRRTGGLRPGAPLLYRGVRIGGVVSSGLASDASAVEVHVHVLPEYKDLVRTNSQFWNASGFKVQVGWGMTLNAESAQTILAGGMAMATPSKAGGTVSDGRRFWLEDREPEGWQGWNPSIPLINPNLPPGVAVPRLVRVALKYHVGGRVWGTTPAERRGLVLPVDGGWLLGPGDLLAAPKEAVSPPPVALTFEGVSLPVAAKKEPGSLGWLKADPPLVPSLNEGRFRTPRAPENCLLVSDAAADTPFVSASQLKETDAGWAISDAGLAREGWHGAAVVAVADGKVIGVLVAPEKGARRIIPLTPELLLR